LKELQSGVGRVAELESERNELQMRVRTLKVELSQMKEERANELTQVKQKLQAKYGAMEQEFSLYKRDVTLKLSKFEEVNDNLFRLQAEIEELKTRNERMQRRLAEKEEVIKELKGEL